MTTSLYNQAVELAGRLHAGQFRKYTGEAYVEHPIRVSQTLRRFGAPEHVVVAGVLHDTIEDCDIDLWGLLEAGIPPASVRLVESVSRRQLGGRKQTYSQFIDQILEAPDPWSPVLKRADILDNLQTLPPGSSLEKRYVDALRRIFLAMQQRPPLLG